MNRLLDQRIVLILVLVLASIVIALMFGGRGWYFFGVTAGILLACALALGVGFKLRVPIDDDVSKNVQAAVLLLVAGLLGAAVPYGLSSIDARGEHVARREELLKSGADEIPRILHTMEEVKKAEFFILASQDGYAPRDFLGRDVKKMSEVYMNGKAALIDRPNYLAVTTLIEARFDRNVDAHVRVVRSLLDALSELSFRDDHELEQLAKSLGEMHKSSRFTRASGTHVTRSDVNTGAWGEKFGANVQTAVEWIDLIKERREKAGDASLDAQAKSHALRELAEARYKASRSLLDALVRAVDLEYVDMLAEIARQVGD